MKEEITLDEYFAKIVAAVQTAFPQPQEQTEEERRTGLRDCFAAQALAGLLANPQIAKDAVKIKIEHEANQYWHAMTAYQFADAMLKEREAK